MTDVVNLKDSLGCIEHFHFGEGVVTVQTATAYGLPALILTHSLNKGIPGQDARWDEPSAEDPDVRKKSVLLTFKTVELRNSVSNALMGVAK